MQAGVVGGGKRDKEKPLFQGTDRKGIKGKAGCVGKVIEPKNSTDSLTLVQNSRPQRK